MLNFSFSTVLMALLASSILVGLIAIVFLRNNTLACAGYKLLGVIVGLVVIRLVFPFELPFTTNVPLPPIMSKIVAFIRKPQIPILNVALSIWNVFEIIWIIGVIFNAVRYIMQYRRAYDHIIKYGHDQTKDIRYKTILDAICMQHNRNNNFRIVELPSMNIPVIYGLKNPYIILPNGLSVSEEQMYYILYHEAMHYFQHDFLIKSIIRFFSIVYWWNPAFNILYNQANTLLEMHIDEIITHSDEDITDTYAECLLYMKKNSLKQTSQPMFDFLKKESCFLVQSQDKDFKRRLVILLQDFAVSKKICMGITLIVLITAVYMTSYLFILEADYRRPQFVEEAILIPNEDTTYLIQDDASHYEVYINGIYTETIDSLEGYPNGIKIYNKKGELIHEN